MKMQASLLYEPGRPLEVADLDLEGPKEDEVMVRMIATGVCHSCLHVVDGSWTGYPMPMVLGDEGAGIVEEVGPGVRHVKPGDHVILSWAPACGRCHYCVTGLSHLCEHQMPGKGVLMDGTSRMKIKGQTVYHYGPACSYASYSVMPASCAVPIRDDMPLEVAASNRMLGHDRCRLRHQHRRRNARSEHGRIRRWGNRPQRHTGRNPRPGTPHNRNRYQPRQTGIRKILWRNAHHRRQQRKSGRSHKRPHRTRGGLFICSSRQRASHQSGMGLSWHPEGQCLAHRPAPNRLHRHI